MLTLETIYRYPVKSTRGESVTSAVIEPWGLAGDRRWMVVDPDGEFVTAREEPRMLLITPEPGESGALVLRSDSAAELKVEVPPADSLGGRRAREVGVWSHRVDAFVAADDASAWLSAELHRPVQLVYLADPRQRHPNPRFARPDDTVTFADAYPVLATSSASLRSLNDWIGAGAHAAEGPLPITRFRPNLVIAGAEPWEEDGWRMLRIGEARFRAVKGCDRCAITMTDPQTAERGKEPVATLARHRRWDGKTWFGMNLIPDTPGVVIRVGDEVEVLESVPAPDGPPR